MTDGFDFERFEQEMHSQLDLEDHAPTLVEEARQVLREHPEAQPVGLILHTEAVEARAFVQAIELRTGQPFRQRGLVGLVPRKFVIEMLRSNYPEMLAVFPAEGHGQTRKLPTVCITRGGARMGISDIEVWKESEHEADRDRAGDLDPDLDHADEGGCWDLDLPDDEVDVDDITDGEAYDEEGGREE